MSGNTFAVFERVLVKEDHEEGEEILNRMKKWRFVKLSEPKDTYDAAAWDLQDIKLQHPTKVHLEVRCVEDIKQSPFIWM